MANGLIVIDKPQGWTSMDVCAKLRGIFHEKRVGHAGTLDPMATGVLPVFVGRATRAVQFAEAGEKEYIAGLRLGLTTNTQDTSGQVLERRPVSVTPEALDAALAQFRGEIDQVPPMYSAIKINGKKLYELARKGVEVERKPRRVTIHALELAEGLSPEEAPPPIDPAGPDSHDFLGVRCSKGTYIRALCHDIGQTLGCGGCMSSLRRTAAAGFSLKDAVTLERVQAADDPRSLLLPVDAYFSGRPALILREGAERKLRNGMTLNLSREGLPAGLRGECRVYGAGGEFLALGLCDGRTLRAVKSFFAV